MLKNEITNRKWTELLERKDEFQGIVRLLVEFDEKTGRYRKYGDQETHYMRKAISVAEPESLRIFLKHLGGFVYYVVAQLISESGHVSTSWVHEDGIRGERDEFKEISTHPVHTILCMTDLYEENSKPLPDDPAEICVDDPTLHLLVGDAEGGA